MTDHQWDNDAQEPAAAGREAFWIGRPVWANPFIGVAARAWKTGWIDGQAELAMLAGEAAFTESEAEQERLLELHRPQDINAPSGRAGKGRVRVRRRTIPPQPTYRLTAPGTQMTSGV